MHPALLSRIAILLWSAFALCDASSADDALSTETVSAQKQAATEFKRFTTNLQFNKDGSVGLIRLSKPEVTDQTLVSLSQFPELNYLAIVCPQVTDAGIVHVAGLKKLDTLLLAETSVTSDGLKAIGDQPRLEVLSLAGTLIDDGAAETIASFVKLRTLSLENTAVGDLTVERMTALENLEALFLDETLISDACFSSLAKLSKLELLSLSKCSLTGDALAELTKLPNLAHLVLSECGLTKNALEQLAHIESLETIELYGTRVSREDIRGIFQPPSTVAVFLDRTQQDRQLDSSVFGNPQATSDPSSTGIAGPISKRLAEKAIPDFQRHVIPLLGRLGCNGRSCHGSFQGKGGFQLSMFGYDFDADLENLRERVDLAHPSESLVVNKPTSDSEHEGGLRFDAGSWQQRLLTRWVDAGARGIAEDASSFERLEVTPKEIVLAAPGETVPLRTVAVWSDGSREDVTGLTRFETTDDAIATVSPDGLVTAKAAGDAHVIAFYDNGVVATQTIMPLGDWSDTKYPEI